MAVLTDDSVIELVNNTGPCATLTVQELKDMILALPIVAQYEGQLANTLQPTQAWALNNTITINITVESTP